MQVTSGSCFINFGGTGWCECCSSTPVGTATRSAAAAAGVGVPGDVSGVGAGLMMDGGMPSAPQLWPSWAPPPPRDGRIESGRDRGLPGTLLLLRLLLPPPGEVACELACDGAPEKSCTFR